MGIFSRLFSGGSKSDTVPGRKTIESDSGKFTTGTEEIVMPLPQIAFIPPAGWSPFTGVKGEQKATDVRIASPCLMGNAGMITCILYPLNGASVASCIDSCLARASDRIVERTEKKSANELSVTFLHTASNVSDSEVEKHVMHCYFLNAAGKVVDLYCVGTTEADSRTAADAFLRTLRLVTPGA